MPSSSGFARASVCFSVQLRGKSRDRPRSLAALPAAECGAKTAIYKHARKNQHVQSISSAGSGAKRVDSWTEQLAGAQNLSGRQGGVASDRAGNGGVD